METTTMSKQFDYYLDAYYACVHEKQELERQGVKNLVVATKQSTRSVELIECYKEGAPVTNFQNNIIEVYRYKKSN